jgi:hypothetical protein
LLRERHAEKKISALLQETIPGSRRAHHASKTKGAEAPFVDYLWIVCAQLVRAV